MKGAKKSIVTTKSTASLLKFCAVICLVLMLFLPTPDYIRADPLTAQQQSASINLGLPPLKRPRPSLVQLGKALFFDPDLSVDGTQSCATCHQPDEAFTQNDRMTPDSRLGGQLSRNAPTLLNSAIHKSFFHDGRSNSLADQSIEPLIDPREMANKSIEDVISRLNADPGYRERFNATFKTPATRHNLSESLAAFQASLIAADSPFDRWFFGGEEKAISESAIRGFRLFKGKATCSACHLVEEKSAEFTDHRFHNTGVAWRNKLRGKIADKGREFATGKSQDRFKFKTPTLRNIALTAPYMHDGSMQNLSEIIAFYNQGAVAHENLDPLIFPLDLTQDEQFDLVDFLSSLTSPAAIQPTLFFDLEQF